MSIHQRYNELKYTETALVDYLIDMAFQRAKESDMRVPLSGDDRCEQAAEALAVWIVASRRPATLDATSATTTTTTV